MLEEKAAQAFRIRAAEVLGVDPDWVLCGNGSDDILTITTRALVGQGQALRTPYPSYVLYRTLAEIQGAECHEVRFRDDWSAHVSNARKFLDIWSKKLTFRVIPNGNLCKALTIQFTNY